MILLKHMGWDKSGDEREWRKWVYDSDSRLICYDQIKRPKKYWYYLTVFKKWKDLNTIFFIFL